MTIARKSDGTFSGVPMFKADVDGLTIEEPLLNVAQDVQLLADMVTGDNYGSYSTAPQTMNHRGYDTVNTNYRGCPLGIPPGQSLLRGDGYMDDGQNSSVDIFAAFMPFYLPHGEASVDIALQVTGLGGGVNELKLYNSSLAEVETIVVTDIGRQLYSFDGLTGGDWYAVGYRTFSSSNVLLKFRAFHNRAGQTGGVLGVLDGDAADPYTIPTTTASSATVVDHASTAIHTNILAADYTYPSAVLTWLNQRLNGLWETITGAPVPGNAARKLADSSTRTAYYDHSQLGKSNEAEIDMPLFAAHCGIVRYGDIATGSVTSNLALRNRRAPGLDTSASGGRTGLSAVCHMPDFPNGASSKLKFVGIMRSDEPAVENQAQMAVGLWERDTDTTRTLVEGGTWTTVSYGSGDMARYGKIEISNLDFTPNEFNIIEVLCRFTGATPLSAGRSMQLVGWTMFFEGA